MTYHIPLPCVNLARVITAAGVDLDTFADRVGLLPDDIHKIDARDCGVHFDTAKKISVALCVSVSDLFEVATFDGYKPCF